MDISELQIMVDACNLRIAELQEEIHPLQMEMKDMIMVREEYLNNILEYVMNDSYAFEHWRKLLPAKTYSNGYWVDTGEQSFKLMLDYNQTDFDEIVAFINRWFPLAKRKQIGIFRYDCGEDGFWSLTFKDDQWIVHEDFELRYDRQIEAKFDDIKDALAYIARNHFYKGE